MTATTPRTARSRGALFAILLIVLATGCRETLARVVNAGVVISGVGCAREPMLPVGDSLHFKARVERRAGHSPSFNPFDGAVLYTSISNPGAFEWSVRFPTAQPGAGIEGRGDAHVTRSGVLIGAAPGYVFLYASSAGASGLVRYLVVPRVLRTTVTPRDTSIRVGDTVTVRLDAELATPWSQRYVVWNPLETGSSESAVTSPAYDAAVDTTSRERRFVARRSGTARIEICVAGTRRDTVLLRVAQHDR